MNKHHLWVLYRTALACFLISCSAVTQPSSTASGTSASLQLSVLRAQLQQDLSELRTNESVRQKAETTDAQRDALQSRADTLRADIARLRAQINGMST